MLDDAMRAELTRELERLNGVCAGPVMPRGKYRGQALATVPTWYLRWAAEVWDGLDGRTRALLTRELDRRHG